MATVQGIHHALSIHDGPDGSTYVGAYLMQGEQATVDTFTFNAWLHMTVPHVGYIWSGDPSAPNVQLLSVGTPPPMPTGVNTEKVRTTGTLNVRNGPGLSYKVVSQLAPGITVQVMGGHNVLADGHNWFELASNQAWWIAGDLTVPVNDSTPVPQPTPPASTGNLLDPTVRGVGANAGGWSPSSAELDLIRRNGVRNVFIIAWAQGQAATAIPAFHNCDITGFAFRADQHGIPTKNPQDFINQTLPNLVDYARALGTTALIIQIHNEPNVIGEGWNNAWANGAEFASWWMQVATQYRAALPGCKLGFPALSPGVGITNVRMAEKDFAAGAINAIRAADWIGLHAYWLDDDGSDFAPEIAYWKTWGKPLIGTEIGPVAPGVITAQAVNHAYQVMRAAGVPCMAWVLDGTGAYPEASWTVHNLTL